MDEETTYEPSEEEMTLYTLSQMVDTLISQLLWLKELIDQELDRLADTPTEHPVDRIPKDML